MVRSEHGPIAITPVEEHILSVALPGGGERRCAPTLDCSAPETADAL